MFRKTFTGSLVAASLSVSALAFMPSATASPTFVSGANISQAGLLPHDASVTMSENGNAVAAWERDGRIQASYFTAGSWTSPATVSLVNKDVTLPHAVINDKGDAVVSWLQKDASDHYQVVTNRYVAGAFGASEQVSEGNTYSVAGDFDAALDNAGQFWAAYRVSDNNTVNRVRVLIDGKSGSAQYSSLGDDSSFAPDIAVNNNGQAVLAFYNAGNGSSSIDVRRYNPATKAWTPAKSVGLAGQYQVETETALGDDGGATVAYVVKDIDGDFRAAAARVNTSGTLTGGSFVSPDNYDASNIDLDQNDKGQAVLAYDRLGGGDYVGFAIRNTPTGNWSSPGIANSALSQAAAPQAVISDSGFTFIGWDDAGHQKALYRAVPYQNMTNYDSGAGHYADGETGVGIDSQGNVLMAGVIIGGDPADGIVTGKFLDTAGPASSVNALPANTFGKTITVKRTASDRFSNVGTYAIRVRTAAWNGTFGAPKTIVSGSNAASFDFKPAAGRTYCFSSLAKDSVGNVGSWSAEKCTTTPVDDRALVIAKGFKRAKAATSYLGTYSIAKKKNAVMSIQHLKASRIAILVTKVAKGGKIQVSFAGKKIGTYSLKGSGNQQLVAVKNLGSLKSGTLVIKVISANGKVVRIDGVVAAK